MRKIIIGIHGLGNKPSYDLLKKWWRQSIDEGLRSSGHSLSRYDFELIYWADILHPKPLDPGITDRKDPLFLSERYAAETEVNNREQLNFRTKAIEYLERYYDRIIVNGVLSLDNESLTELFIHLHMRDLERYYGKELVRYKNKLIPVRKAIIERCAETLSKYKGRKILFIAHSMGSLILHDALTEFPGRWEIDTLLTAGSPLGQKYVLHKYNEEVQKGGYDKRNVPPDILSRWYNLSDLEDQVAINHKLGDIYKKNSNGVSVFDQTVRNNYKSNGFRNPHKSFGYLRTPEAARIIMEFLNTEDRHVKKGIVRKIFRLLFRKF